MVGTGGAPTRLVAAPAAALAPPLGAIDDRYAGTSTLSPEGSRAGETSAPDLQGWADTVGPAIGVPPIALAAYGRAELAVTVSYPTCRLAWPTLAGIGWVESHHGQFDGAVLEADGHSDPPIVGVALDGGVGIARQGDTDDGALDGDATYDRAVGPMQFVPTTWARWASDADGDGRSDPYDLDDASLAAARYLCASGRDLTSGTAWRDAVFSYNHSDAYVAQVWSAADTYAKASLRVPPA